MPGVLRVALVHKMPTPYRVPVFDLVDDQPDADVTVVYSSQREPNRRWTVAEGRARSVYLTERLLNLGENKYVHLNWGVGRTLRGIRPHVVMTNGYNVTDLLVLLHARRTGAGVVCQIDGTPDSERTLTPVHRLVRRLAHRWTDAYAGPSEKSLELFRSFGATEHQVFWSPLAVDNTAFPAPPLEGREFDLLFSGRLTDVKNPLFAVRVAGRTAERLGRRVSLLVTGSGELEEAMREEARRFPALDVTFRGFLQQDELPSAYASAKVFLFPTTWDPWGLVANEAAAAGTPTIISPAAGAADELIRDGEGGLVLPLDEAHWVDAAVRLLRDEDEWRRLSTGSRDRVADYTWQAAADGLAAAIRAAGGAAAARARP
ncbi:glycosyltransferase family 4 protein [Amnibacterium endophyticum]|uniref:D-inositol 3-phosphate glycosyltransferase n=1 Tax=Amnibacterium endophyticum TaxID=2109337 RepID=A0ABW4LDY2_9MICO